MDEKKEIWKLFKALGEPNRFELLLQLCGANCPCNVSQLAEVAPLDQSVVSRHLKIMREAGVLLADKVGRETKYRVNGELLANTLRQMAKMIESCDCCGTNCNQVERTGKETKS